MQGAQNDTLRIFAAFLLKETPVVGVPLPFYTVRSDWNAKLEYVSFFESNVVALSARASQAVLAALG